MNYTITLNETEMKVLMDAVLGARNEVFTTSRQLRDKCLNGAAIAVWDSYSQLDDLYGKLCGALSEK